MNDLKVINKYNPTVIEHNIEPIVDKVKQKIADLNIDEMEVSEENKQTLKNARADLNKDKKEYEAERIKIKNFVLQPYSDFESLYKSDLLKVIDDAVNDLDKKIKSIEKEQLEEKKEYAREYFGRKMESDPIDVANTLDDVNIKFSINMSSKKIREAIDFHFEKINSSLTIINNSDNSARLRAIWETEAKYDIGIALTKLSQQLAVEKQYKEELPDVSSMYPKQMKEEASNKKQSVSFIPEELFDFTLKITLSERQLDGLTNYMSEEGIDFEVE